MTDHRWTVLGGDRDQLKQCSLCKAVTLDFRDDEGGLDDYTPVLAGVGDEYVVVRPAPKCPPTCEETTSLWRILAVQEVTES